MHDLATAMATGAHALFHGSATTLGIRPAGAGFEWVEIAPLLSPLRSIYGSPMHPRGSIEVELQVGDGELSGTISLPAGVRGTLRYAEVARELAAGAQQ